MSDENLSTGDEAATEEQAKRRVWAVLTEEERKRPGAVLLGWLFRAANDQNLNLQELAKALDVSYGYISQLRGGVREVRGVSGQFLGNCAAFLRVPRISVMIAAGVVSVEDFFDNPEQFDAEIDTALHYIAQDATFGAMMPVDLMDASKQTKMFVIQLYQQATGRKLLSSEVDLATILTTVEQHKSLLAD
jgi:transcriptional regulator with XRE-family HTH domain